MKPSNNKVSQQQKDRQDALRLRRMELSDMDAAQRLSRLANWNQLKDDWLLLHQLHPDGAFVAQHADQVVGTVTTTQYENKIGWIGMVLVDPVFRGQGIATQLLEVALKASSSLETLLLDATPAGRPVYEKLGFIPNFDLTRMIAERATVPRQVSNSHLRPMQESDLYHVCQLDQQNLGVNRMPLLKELLRLAPAYAWVHQSQEGIDSFIMGRHGAHFEWLGPLVSPRSEIGIQLCSKVLASMEGHPCGTDIPNAAVSFREFLESVGMRAERPFTRMYRGRVPQAGSLKSLLSIAGPELG